MYESGIYENDLNYILDGGGDVQTTGTRRGKLARVDIGNLPDSGVDVFQVLSLHHQDGLGRVEVELQGGEERCKQWVGHMLNAGWLTTGSMNKL